MNFLPARFTLLAFLCLTCFQVRSEPPGNVITQAGNIVITEGWGLANDDDGISVYTRSRHNSDIHEALVTTEILAPPWRVNAVLADYQNHPEFMPYVSETVVVRDEPAKVSVFQQLDFFPIPIADRYYTIRIIMMPDRLGVGSYQIGWSLENEASFVRKGEGVSVPVNAGSWELRPSNNGTSTLVNYYHMADPGGWIPTWVINQATVKILPKMIKAVKKQVSAPQYDKFMSH